MDGLMNGWMNRWMDGWMDGLFDGQIKKAKYSPGFKGVIDGLVGVTPGFIICGRDGAIPEVTPDFDICGCDGVIPSPGVTPDFDICGRDGVIPSPGVTPGFEGRIPGLIGISPGFKELFISLSVDSIDGTVLPLKGILLRPK